MAFSGFLRVVVLLWFATQVEVLAGKREWRENLDHWREESSGNSDKVLETWLYVGRGHRLYTEVKPGGASWFITPSLNLPNTSYLEIEASCSNNPCQLEIYGTSQGSARVFKNYESVQNLTFETQRISTTTIKKSYPHLYILARTSKTSTTTKFSIFSIKIYQYFCENRTLYNTDLSQVYSSTASTSKLVQCPDNAIASDGKSTNITVKCTPKGNWAFGDRKCVCDKGFFFSNQRCLPVVGKATQTTNSETKCKYEVKASANSIVMFFVGPGVTLAIVLFIVIFILVYKRCMKTPNKSTNVPAIETVEMQDQSLAEPGATQSQNEQSYVSSVGDETRLHEEVSTSAVYTELNRSRQDKKTAPNTYQKLLKHDS